MTITITKYLENCGLDLKDHWVLYYFCSRNQPDRDTAASTLKNLIFSLCQEDPSLAKYLYDQWCTQGSSLFADHQIEGLWAIFETMINNCKARRIYCIIDGIDNCGIDENDNKTLHSDTLHHLLRKLNKMFSNLDDPQSSHPAEMSQRTLLRKQTDPSIQSTAAQKMRMMVLTRELPLAMMKELASFPQLPMSRSAELSSLITNKMRRVSTVCAKRKDPNDEMREIIDKVLSSGQDQSFLFVGLVSDKMESMTLNQLRKYSKTAPTSVGEFHCQTLHNIPPRQRPAVLATLKWVALAERPLTSLQLTKAVKYSLRKSFSKKSLDKILTLCHGLVLKIEHRIVLGQEVFELLFDTDSPLLRTKQLKEFVSEAGDTHSELTNACIAYLQDSTHLEKSRRVRLRESDVLKKADREFFRKHPFLEYAIINWTYHAKRGNLDKTKYDVPFFGERLPRRRLWWESYWISLPLRHWVAWKWTAPGNFSLLHLAAFFDIVPLAKYVENEGQLEQLLQSEDHQGLKPINWATKKSASGMV